MHGFIEEIGIALIIATILGLLTQKVGQPIILGYFIAGAIIGPEIGLKWVSDPANIEIISEIGLVLLLFVIGLEMDLPKILKAGKKLLIAGIGQFALCVLYGLVFFKILGFGWSETNLGALYMSLLCGLSSTAIVVKLLYDKMELDTLHGRIALGILILQDIWAVLILAFQPNLNQPQIGLFAFALIKSFALLTVSYLLSKYLLGKVFQWISKSPELIVGASLGWCVFVSGLAAFLGLSKEMGALIAGVAISAFPYNVFVSAKVLPLRDFFLTLFFVSLGMKIPHFSMSSLSLAGLTGLFILASRFLSIYPLLSWTGSGRRTAFISSLNLSQISEFSLVIASIGLNYKHIDSQIMILIIYTMALTAIISSYLIQFNHQIFVKFDFIANKLGFPEKRRPYEDLQKEKKSFPIVILGFHRGAKAFVDEISHKNHEALNKILVIDFNLEILKEIRNQGIEGIYGDISHLDTLHHAHIQDAKIILSTIPDMLLKGTKNADLVRMCRSLNPTAYIIATADFSAQVQELINLGANEVALPYSLAGKFLVHKIRETHLI